MKYILFAINAILTFQFAQAQIADTNKAHEPSGAAVSSVEDTLIQIEHDWGNALLKADVAAWSRYLGDDWVLTYSDGTLVTKPMALADLKEGALRIESFRLDDVKVRVYGDAAVVTGLITEKSKFRDKDTSGVRRFTDVFVKRDGRWHAIASHESDVSALAFVQASTSDDESAVRKVLAEYTDSWNRHDMAAFARLFTDDVDYVNIAGVQWKGVQENVQRHAELFQNRLKTAVQTPTGDQIRFLRPDIALVHTTWDVTGWSRPTGEPVPVLKEITTMVMIKTNGKWLITAFQNTERWASTKK